MDLSLNKIFTILFALVKLKIFVFGQEKEIAKINKYLDKLPSVEVDINEIIKDNNREFFKKRGVDIDAVHANLKKLKEKPSHVSENKNKTKILKNVKKTKTEKPHSDKKDSGNHKSSHNARRQTVAIATTKTTTTLKQTTKFIFNVVDEELQNHLGSLQEIEGQFKAAHGEFEHAEPKVDIVMGMASDPDLRSLDKPKQKKRQRNQYQRWNGIIRQSKKGADRWVLSENDTVVLKYANNNTRSVRIDSFRSVLYPKNTRTLSFFPSIAASTKSNGSLRKAGFESDFLVPDVRDPGGPHGFDQEADAAKALRAGFDSQYSTGPNGMGGRGPMMDQGGPNWMGQMGMGMGQSGPRGIGPGGGEGPMGMGPNYPNVPIGIGPNGPMGMGPNNPMEMGPNGPMGMGPNDPMGMGPNNAMGMGPNGPMEIGPNGPMGMGQNGPMGMGQNGPMGMGPNGPMGMVPNDPMGMGPNGPMGMGPNDPMGMGPNGLMGMGSGGPMGMGQMGMGPNGPMGMGPGGPIVMGPNSPMGMSPNGQMVMGSNDPVGMGPGGPMEMGPYGPMGMGPNSPMGTDTNGQMGMGPNGPMGMVPDGSVGMGPNVPMGIEPNFPMGMGPDGPMGMGSNGPMGMGPYNQMSMGPGSPLAMGPNGPMAIGPGDPMDKGLTELVPVGPNVPMGPNDQPVNYSPVGLPNSGISMNMGGNGPMMNMGQSGQMGNPMRPEQNPSFRPGRPGFGPGWQSKPEYGVQQVPNGAYMVQPTARYDGFIPPANGHPGQFLLTTKLIDSLGDMKEMAKTPPQNYISGIDFRNDGATSNPGITDPMELQNQTNSPESIVDNRIPPIPRHESPMNPTPLTPAGGQPNPYPTTLRPAPKEITPNLTGTILTPPTTTTTTKKPKPSFVPGPNEPLNVNFSDPNEPLLDNYPDMIGRETTRIILTPITTTATPEKVKADVQSTIKDKRPIHLQAKTNMKLNLNGMFTEGMYQFCSIMVNKSTEDASNIFQQFSRTVNWLRVNKKLHRFGEPATKMFRKLLMEEIIEPIDLLQARCAKMTHWMREERGNLGPDVNAILEFVDRLYNAEEEEGVLNALEKINEYPNIQQPIYNMVFNFIDYLIIKPYGRLLGTVKELILNESVNRVLSMSIYGHLGEVITPAPVPKPRRDDGNETIINDNIINSISKKLEKRDKYIDQLRQLLVKNNQSASIVNLTDPSRRSLYEIALNKSTNEEGDSKELVRGKKKDSRRNYYPEYDEEKTRNHKENFGNQQLGERIGKKIYYYEESAMSGENVNPNSENKDKPIILPPKHQFRSIQPTYQSRTKSPQQNIKSKAINIDVDYSFDGDFTDSRNVIKDDIEKKIRKDADTFVTKTHKMKESKKHIKEAESAKIKHHPSGFSNKGTKDKEANNRLRETNANKHQTMRKGNKRLHGTGQQEQYVNKHNVIRQFKINTPNNFDYLYQYKDEENVDRLPWRENVNIINPENIVKEANHKKRQNIRKEAKRFKIEKEHPVNPNLYQSNVNYNEMYQDIPFITPGKSENNVGKLGNIPQPPGNIQIPIIRDDPIQSGTLNDLPEFQYDDNQIDYDMPMWTTEPGPKGKDFKGFRNANLNEKHHKSKHRELTPLTDKQIQKINNNINIHNTQKVTDNAEADKDQNNEFMNKINVEKEIKKTLHNAERLHKQIKTAEMTKKITSASDEYNSKHHRTKHKALKRHKSQKHIDKLKNKLSKEIKKHERQENKLRHLKHDHPKIYEKYIKKHDIHDKRNHNHKYEKFLHDNIHHKKSKEPGRAGHIKTKHKHRKKHHKHKNKNKRHKKKNSVVFRARPTNDSEYIEVFTGVSSETTSDSTESDQITLPVTMMGPMESAERETTKIKRYIVTRPATPHRLTNTMTSKAKLREKHRYALDVRDFRGKKVTPAKLNTKKRYSVVKRPKNDKGKGEDINKYRNKEQYLQTISRFKKVARNGTDLSDIRADSFSSVSSCSTDSDQNNEMSRTESESYYESENEYFRHFNGLEVPVPVQTVGIGTLPTSKRLSKRPRLLTTHKMKEFTKNFDRFKNNHMLQFKNVKDDKVAFRISVDEDAKVSEDEETDFEIFPQTNLVRIYNEAYYAYDAYRRRDNNRETNVTQNKDKRKVTVQVNSSKELQRLVKDSHERKELAILAVAKDRKIDTYNKKALISQTSSEFDEEPILKDKIYKHLGYDSNIYANNTEVTLKSKRRMQNKENSLAEDVKKSSKLMKAFENKLSPKIMKISLKEVSKEVDEEGLLRNNLNKLL